MKRIWAFAFILLIVVGCSNDDKLNQTVKKYENKIENQEKEIQELKEENEQLKTDIAEYSSYLQVADRQSRNIMGYISDGKFEELKNEYNVEFNLKDDKIDFGVPESNLPFPIKLAGYPMHIASFSMHPDGVDINYFIYDLEKEESHLINMSFDKDREFEFIFFGGR